MSRRAIASSITGSVPGHGANQKSALAPVFDSRGIDADHASRPLALASMIRWACGLK